MNGAFSHDVMAAILGFQNNTMKKGPCWISKQILREFFSHVPVNAFFFFNKFS